MLLIGMKKSPSPVPSLETDGRGILASKIELSVWGFSRSNCSSYRLDYGSQIVHYLIVPVPQNFVAKLLKMFRSGSIVVQLRVVDIAIHFDN